MTSRIARSIAAVVVGSVLAVASAGIAAASTVDNGTGSSSTEAAGARVLELRDQLTKVAYAGDVTATRDTMARIDPLLAQLSQGQRYTIQAESQQAAGVARHKATEVTEALTDPGAAEARQVPPTPELPPLPGPLSMVNGLLQSLLLSLSGLLDSLLGSAPPLPVPPAPVPPAPLP